MSGDRQSAWFPEALAGESATFRPEVQIGQASRVPQRDGTAAVSVGVLLLQLFCLLHAPPQVLLETGGVDRDPAPVLRRLAVKAENVDDSRLAVSNRPLILVLQPRDHGAPACVELSRQGALWTGIAGQFEHLGRGELGIGPLFAHQVPMRPGDIAGGAGPERNRRAWPAPWTVQTATTTAIVSATSAIAAQAFRFISKLLAAGE